MRPLDLTAGTRWEFRAVVSGEPRPWRGSLAQAVRGLAPRLVHVPWPREWSAYGTVCANPPVRRGAPPPPALPPAEVLASLPAHLEDGGERLERHAIRADGDGFINLAATFGPPRDHRIAWLLAERDSPRDEELDLHIGGDWWMQVLVDGAPVFDRLASGNGSPVREVAWRVPVRLARGRHVIAARVRSGNGGWAFVSAATRRIACASDAEFTVEARRVFTVADPTCFSGLTFLGEPDSRVRLNGAELPLPLAGMHYERIDGIPPDLLRRGLNELTRSWDAAAARSGAALAALRGFRHSRPDRRLEVAGRLHAIPPEAVAIRTGPFVAPLGDGAFGISCRTDAPAAVELDTGGTLQRSPTGLIHRFRIARGGRYRLRVAGTLRSRGATVPALPQNGPLRLAIWGDPSPQPAVLARILAAMRPWKPHLAIALGDNTADGRDDARWDRELHALHPAWFAATPHLWVAGNHDESSPLMPRLLMTPGSDATGPSPLGWNLAVGGLRLIGIDGLDDWSAGSANLLWLDRVLAAAAEPYVLLLDHYPAWSSTSHGAPGADGRPHQRTVRESREQILPMLIRHRATAFINGHAHCYERSHPPGGVACITSGGAGGFLYASNADSGFNPHSAIMAPRHHWCRLVHAEGRLDLEAVALDDGAVIDRHVFTVRDRGR